MNIWGFEGIDYTVASARIGLATSGGLTLPRTASNRIAGP
jgi:hypothetical protein